MHARVSQSWKKRLAVGNVLMALLWTTGAAWAVGPDPVPSPAPVPAAPGPVAPAPAKADEPAGVPASAPAAEEHGKGGKPCDDCDEHGKGGKPCDDCDEHGKGGKPCDDCDEHGKGGKPCDDCGEDGDEPCDCDEHAGGDREAGAEHDHGGRPGHGGPDHRGPGMGRDPGRGFMGIGIKPELLLQFQPAILTGEGNQLSRGDRAELPGFSMRTARLGLSGDFARRARFVLDTDLVTIAQTPVTQAFIGLSSWKNAELLVGAHKVPFSRFAMLGSGEQALIERPLSVQAMAPFYQLGATMTGHYPDLLGLRWYVGGYNSFDRQTNFYAGIHENSGLNGNRFGGISLAGRVQLEPFGDMGRPVADLDHKRFRLEVGGGYLFNDSGTTRSNAMSADVQVKFRGAHAIVEVLQDDAQPRALPTTPQTIPAKLTRRAIIAEVGYALYRFNAAARVELVDPNTDLKDNRDEKILSGALGYQVMRNRLRVQLQFDHRAENLQQISNDTLFAQVQLML